MFVIAQHPCDACAFGPVFDIRLASVSPVCAQLKTVVPNALLAEV